MAGCPARRRLDDGLSEILGLPNLDNLRRLLATEPVVSIIGGCDCGQPMPNAHKAIALAVELSHCLVPVAYGVCVIN